VAGGERDGTLAVLYALLHDTLEDTQLSAPTKSPCTRLHRLDQPGDCLKSLDHGFLIRKARGGGAELLADRHHALP